MTFFSNRHPVKKGACFMGTMVINLWVFSSIFFGKIHIVFSMLTMKFREFSNNIDETIEFQFYLSREFSNNVSLSDK